MNANASFRAVQAAERRQLRDAQKRQRDLERLAKDQAKLSEIERARLEVDAFNNQLDVLLSVHKEQGEVWDWAGLAAALPPIKPKKHSYNEFQARREIPLLPPIKKQFSDSILEQARAQDDLLFQKAMLDYSSEYDDWKKLGDLARRIIAGEHKAYTEALVEFSPFAEISELGSSINFTIHNEKLLECDLKVNGKHAIPLMVKTLTVAQKLSVKPMPKGRFHDLYQDYLCSCIIRVAREVFALLPVDFLLVTASVDTLNPRTESLDDQKVFSASIPRSNLQQLDFDAIDPSDAMDNFFHRGDFKASRKSEAFTSITPLTPADIMQTLNTCRLFSELLANTKSMREELRAKIAEISPNNTAFELQTDPTSSL